MMNGERIVVHLFQYDLNCCDGIVNYLTLVGREGISDKTPIQNILLLVSKFEYVICMNVI